MIYILLFMYREVSNALVSNITKEMEKAVL